MQTRVAIAGASGRLGSVMSEVVEAHPDFTLTERLGRASAPEAWLNADLLIDATTPELSPQIVSEALARGQRVIVGTSGWDEERVEVLKGEISRVPGASVIVVPNFSLGSVLGTALSTIAARYFDAVEIIESHHPNKIDSPSGTAVHTAQAMMRAREGRLVDAPFAEQAARGQQTQGVPIHSLRLAGVVAKQEVRFGGVGETLTITHDTISSDSYRAGVRAALEASHGHEGLTVGLGEILGVS